MKQINKISYIDKKGNIVKMSTSERSQKPTTRDYSQYLNIGFYLAAPLLIGVFLGVKLDDWLNLKPFFTISLIVLGAIASFYNLFRLTKDA